LTAIAAIVSEVTGRVFMAGDSAVTSGWDLSLRPGGKVFRHGPYVMGVSGGMRGAQIVQYAFHPPEPDGDLHAFMSTAFVDALRTAYKDGGYGKKDSERESSEDNILVGVNGHLFTVWSHYSVDESSAPYAAVGCGAAYATGSLHGTHGTPMRPRARLETALQAAEQFSAGVRGPFTYVSTRKDEP
jgi:ATP-dependent protease HslVU (ClpYQ) peptidase subunit